MTNIPKVSIVVLSWNSMNKTLNCIDSILKTNYENYEIILVDNGSKSDTVELLKEKYGDDKKIKLIFNETNLGSAEGRNVGFRNASNKSKYIAFFDNDTIIPKEYVWQLVAVLENNEKIKGVNGAFVEYGDIYPQKSTTLTLVAFDAPYYDIGLKNKPIRLSVSLTGSGCMYEKEFIKPCPFMKKYFFGGEEIYVGLLVYLRGGKCAKILNAPYKHLSQNTFQRTKSSLASFHATKNRLLSIILFFETKTLIKLFPLLMISQLTYFLYFPRLFFSKIKAYSWILFNIGSILKHRKKLQNQRKVSDKQIIRYMSGKFQDPNILNFKFGKKILSLLNGIFLFYCKIVRLKVVEFCQNDKSS
tara:strand:+ start:2176 stop:3252 length:1077 start_codon:yes stop_codon:yes gene_type:complete